MFLKVATYPQQYNTVRTMIVNPIRGIVVVEFTYGNVFEYRRVSRRAILNLLATLDMDTEHWVRLNCVHNLKTEQIDLTFYTTDQLRAMAA